jgi:hypothetical protein
MIEMMAIRIVTAVFLVGTVLAVSVYGARFPNAVEKRILISGEAAISIAGILGLNTSGPSSISLQLGRNDAWAVYLLKQDHEIRLWNDNEGSPTRYNKVEFSTTPVPSLIISPYWLDLATRLPESKLGYYSFGSPFISDEFDPNGPWTQILLRLMREPGWNADAKQPFNRCFTSMKEIDLCVDVFHMKDYTNNIERNGFRIEIEAHIKNE